MAEKIPETNVPKAKLLTLEHRSKSDVSHGRLTPEDRSETGYGSAPYSSDVLSGAEATSESAIWTSEDHDVAEVQTEEPPSTMKRVHKRKGSKKQAEGSESDTKPEKSQLKSPEKASKTRSLKKSTPVKQIEPSVKSSQESPPRSLASELQTTPPKSGGSATPKKGKSPKSFFQRFKSPRKLTESPRGTGTHEGSSAEVQSTSPKSKEATTSSPEGAKTSPKRGKSKTPQKGKGLFRFGKSKSPAKPKSASTSGRSGSEAPATAPKSNKPDKIPEGKTKLPAELQKADEEQHSGVMASIAATYDIVSSGMQNIQVTTRRGSDTVPLLRQEESADVKKLEDPRVRKASDARRQRLDEEMRMESATDLRREVWKPQHDVQEGGFLHKDVVSSLASSIDENTTEYSTVSDSSVFPGGSESKKGSSDSLSDIPDLQEEGAVGGEVAEKPQLRRQKRVKDKSSSDSDDDAKAYRDICGSPTKKVAPPRDEPKDSDE